MAVHPWKWKHGPPTAMQWPRSFLPRSSDCLLTKLYCIIFILFLSLYILFLSLFNPYSLLTGPVLALRLPWCSGAQLASDIVCFIFCFSLSTGDPLCKWPACVVINSTWFIRMQGEKALDEREKTRGYFTIDSRFILMWQHLTDWVAHNWKIWLHLLTM